MILSRKKPLEEMPDSDPDKSDLRVEDTLAVTPSATNQDQNGHQNLVKYGELVILGYNGQLPQGKKSFS